jgi:hypothetical protein
VVSGEGAAGVGGANLSVIDVADGSWGELERGMQLGWERTYQC